MATKKISKKEAIEHLDKYGIEFGFPQNRNNGELITVWSDWNHSTKGETTRLIELIDADPDSPFTTFPDMMMCTFRLKRK